MKTLFALIFNVLLVLPSAAQDYAADCRATARSRALCETEAALTEALRTNNAARLEQLYAAEFQLINFRGRQVDRAGVVAAVRSGALRFDALTTSDQRLRLLGDSAVISGVQHQVAQEPGSTEAHPADVRFTHIYVWRNDRWLLLASQITPIVTTPSKPGVDHVGRDNRYL